jgi:CelD/BcsL family acetyltransferase involved in cellulose biosynthesis
MFDYVKNKYNQYPAMVTEDDMNNESLYVKYINAPYLILPKTVEEFNSAHKSKFWYNIKRSARMYEDTFGKLSFEVVTNTNDLNFFLDQVFDLFNQRWKDEYLSTPWKCKEGFEKYKEAMIELSKSDNAFLAVLYDENKKLLSYAYCLSNNQTAYFYQYTTTTEDKYKKFSLGKFLLYRLLLNLIESHKYKIFDFMNGEQEYKMEWTKQTKSIYFQIDDKGLKSYIKYFLLKFKIYLQFNDFFRDKLKMLFKIKENFFGKC